MSNTKRYTIRTIVFILVFIIYAFWRRIDVDLGHGAISAFIRVSLLYLILHFTWGRTKIKDSGIKRNKIFYLIGVFIVCIWWFTFPQDKNILYQESINQLHNLETNNKSNVQRTNVKSSITKKNTHVLTMKSREDKTSKEKFYYSD